MPSLDRQTFQDIVNLLIPHCGDPVSRKTLATKALYGCHVLERIDFAGTPQDYVVHFVTTLLSYGECTDRKPALISVLEEIRTQVGTSQHEQINMLISSVPVGDDSVHVDDWNIPPPPSGEHVFISYSRADLATVRRITTDLLKAGVNVWIDQIGLKPGTLDWEQALRDAIEGAYAVLFMASPSARRSTYVRDELAIAQARNTVIYPVWVAGDHRTDVIPMGLGYVQLVDIRANAYDQGLQQLIDGLQTADTEPESVKPPIKIDTSIPVRNPYKGLRAFQTSDADDFFGRDDLIEELLTSLRGDGIPPYMLSVLGASGSGKSSVVMAGLLPRLQAGAINNSENWLYLDPMVPGTYPLENLTIALHSHMKGMSQRAIQEDLQSLNKRGLYSLTKSMSDMPVVLYIDQFEELFTQTHDDLQRRQFIDLLTTAVSEPAGNLIIIVTMRADFYDRPAQYSALASLMEDYHVLVKPMSLADLYDVVQKPAAQSGLIFDEGLVTEMVFAVREEPAALPLLQFTLDQLYERRDGRKLTLEAYKEIGGVQGALAKHAEATYHHLPSDAHRTMALALFLRLIEPGASEQDTTRRRATFDELTLNDPIQTQILQETASIFVDSRLLMTNQVNEQRTIEVAHEALLRSWERLSDWVEANRRALGIRDQLVREVQQWNDNNLASTFLAPEGRLALYRQLEDDPNFSLSIAEKAFIKASDERLQAHIEREHENLRRIAEQAQNLAEERQGAAEQARRSAGRIRIAFGVAVVLLLIASMLAIMAYISEQQAQTNAALAEERRITAEAAQENAEIQAVNATVAQGETILQALTAEAAQQNAEAQATLAEAQATLAGEQALTAQAAQQNAEAQATLAGEQALTAQAAQENAEAQAALAGEQALTAQAAQENAEAQAVTATVAQGETILQVTLAEERRITAEAAQENAEAQRIMAEAAQEDAQTQAAFAEEQRITAEAAQEEAEIQAVNATVAQGETILQVTQVAAAQQNAERQAFIAEENASESQSRSLAAKAELLLNAGDYQLAAMLAQHANLLPGAPLDVQRVLSLAAYNGPREIARPAGLASPINVIVNCGSNNFIVGYEDGTIRYYLITTRISAPLAEVNEHNAGITALACDVNGSQVASGDRNGNIIIWNLNAFLQREQTLRYESLFVSDIANESTPTPNASDVNEDDHPSVLSIAFVPDAAFLMVGYEDVTEDFSGRLVLWDINAEDDIVTLEGHRDGVSSVVFLSDATRLITAALDGELILWDISNLFEEQAREYDILRREPNGEPVYQLALNPDESRVASAARDGVIKEWDTSTLQEQGRMTGHTGPVRSINYGFVESTGTTYLVSASDDRSIILWDVSADTRRELGRYRAHTQAVTGVAFNAGVDRIVSVSLDRHMMLWDRKGGAEELRTSLPDVAIQDGFDIGGRFGITTSGSGIYLWNTSSFSISYNRDYLPGSGHESDISARAISPQGDRFVTGDEEGNLILWQTSQSALAPIVTWNAHPNPIRSIAFSPDGQTIATGSEDRLIKLWAVDRRQQIGEFDPLEVFSGNIGTITALAFCCDDSAVPVDSPRRSMLASGSDSGELFIWDVNGAINVIRPATHSTRHEGGITALMFSPDGTRLVTASEDNTLIAWEVNRDSDEPRLTFLTRFRQHDAPVRSVDFSPNGEFIISASDDHTVIVWDVATGSPISALIGHTATVNSVRFISNTRAVSSGDDGVLIFWRIESRDALINWIRLNRDIQSIDCETRLEYGVTPFCEENELGTFEPPTLTPAPVLTSTPRPTGTNTPEFSPTPTATITATATMVLENVQDSATVLGQMKDANLFSSGWYETERRDLDIIDLSFSRDTVSWQNFERVYSNFVIHTKIIWGAGSLQDRCGITLHYADRENYHTIQVDQLGNVFYIEQRNDVWLDEGEPFTNPNYVETLPGGINTRGEVDLIVHVDGRKATVYIQEVWANPIEFEFDADSRDEGYVGLAATVLANSREAGCSFIDSWIADLTLTAAPSTPTPVPTLAPLNYPDDDLIPQDVIVSAVQQSIGGTEFGYLSEQVSRIFLDLSEFDNAVQSTSIQTAASYTNFIASATFSFDTASREDECGLSFRVFNNDFFYLIGLSPFGDVTFREVDNGHWQPARLIANNVPVLDANNTLIVVGLDVTEEGGLPESRFVVFINDNNVGEIRDGTNQQGGVELQASVGDESDTGGCIFERAWVWNLDEESLPTPTPTLAADSPQTLELNQTAEGDLPVGGRNIWILNNTQPGRRVIVSVTAERPANDADIQSSIARRLLDVELRVNFVAGDGTQAIQIPARDIVPGQETNIRIELTLENTGDYNFEVFSAQNATGGSYTIRVEDAGDE